MSASTWQVVQWDELRGRPSGEVLAEFDTREEAESALAEYGDTDKVGLREHLAPLSLDAYMDRGGR